MGIEENLSFLYLICTSDGTFCIISSNISSNYCGKQFPLLSTQDKTLNNTGERKINSLEMEKRWL